MSFLEPQRLWLLLLIPLLVVLYFILTHRKRHYAIRFTNLALLDTVIPRRTNWRQHTAVALLMLSLAASVVAFAKPAEKVKVPVERATVVVTIDVSLSMEATDVDPNRLAAAQAAAKNFLSRLPPQFNVALVSFARSANVIVPPTLNREQVVTAIDGLQLGEYTATGEGIFTSLDAIDLVPPDPQNPDQVAPARIVLLSDGKRTVGRSGLEAAQAAKEKGVPVFTVALGTPNGIIVSQGETVPVPVEVGQLQEIADASGGEAYVAGDADTLSAVYEDLGSSLGFTYGRQDVTSKYVGYLVLLSLLSSVGGLFIASRWP